MGQGRRRKQKEEEGRNRLSSCSSAKPWCPPLQLGRGAHHHSSAAMDPPSITPARFAGLGSAVSRPYSRPTGPLLDARDGRPRGGCQAPGRWRMARRISRLMGPTCRERQCQGLMAEEDEARGEWMAEVVRMEGGRRERVVG
jgi:hypothetical protein